MSGAADDARKAQLVALIQEGKAIYTKINEQIGQSTLLSLGKLAAYFMLNDEEWEGLQDLDRYVRDLSLPSPVLDIYVGYDNWNRRCDELFHRYRWRNDERVKSFMTLRREFGGEMSRKTPRLQLLSGKIAEQVSILESLVGEPPKVREPAVGGEISRKKIRKGWSTRKITYAGVYVMLCAVADLLILPIVGASMVGIVGVEVAMLLGFPKLVEWLKK